MDYSLDHSLDELNYFESMYSCSRVGVATQEDQNTSIWNNYCTTATDEASGSKMISFEKSLSFSNSMKSPDQRALVATSRRSPSQAQYHMVAERKRRQKLSHQFVALSALLPTLQKVLSFKNSMKIYAFFFF